MGKTSSCIYCSGTGKRTCPFCHGSGHNLANIAKFGFPTLCHNCHGSGRENCTFCGGTRKLKKNSKQ